MVLNMMQNSSLNILVISLSLLKWVSFGLVQLAHLDKVKEKNGRIPEWNQFLNNIYFVRTGILHPDGEIVWMHFPSSLKSAFIVKMFKLLTSGVQTQPSIFWEYNKSTYERTKIYCGRFL